MSQKGPEGGDSTHFHAIGASNTAFWHVLRYLGAFDDVSQKSNIFEFWSPKGFPLATSAGRPLGLQLGVLNARKVAVVITHFYAIGSWNPTFGHVLRHLGTFDNVLRRFPEIENVRFGRPRVPPCPVGWPASGTPGRGPENPEGGCSTHIHAIGA